MSGHAAALEEATIKQQCKVLRMPAVAAQCAQLATEAVRDRRTHLSFLEALLAAELEERECNLIERRLREARLPRLKTLEDFDFAQCPKVSAVQIHELAQGAYIERAEPIIFIGDSGTGKTHLLTGLAVAACRQKPGYDLRPLPAWSTSWSKPNINYNSAAYSPAGHATTLSLWMKSAMCRWPKSVPSSCFKSWPSGPKRPPLS
jgi:DNA replication protein DnaC